MSRRTTIKDGLSSSDPLLAACTSFYAVPWRDNRQSCVDALAEGANSVQDFCPACTRWFMAAIEAQAGRPMRWGWHRNYAERANGVADKA